MEKYIKIPYKVKMSMKPLIYKEKNLTSEIVF